MTENIERRVDHARELGKLSGIVESLERTQAESRREILASLNRIDSRFEAVSTILSQHLREDSNRHADIDDLQYWRNGKDGKAGAEDNIRSLQNNKVWVMGVAATLSVILPLIITLGPSIVKALGQ